MFIVLVCILGICVKAQETSLPSCTPESINNGQGYLAHPRCERFIQCSFSSSGDVMVHEKACGCGTFWNQNARTCVLPSQSACTNDPCSVRNINSWSYADNCGAFWSCSSGKTIGTNCCPNGYRYNTAYATDGNVEVCVEDHTCTVNCPCAAGSIDEYYTNTEQHSDKGGTQAQSKTSMTKVFKPAIGDTSNAYINSDPFYTQSVCDGNKFLDLSIYTNYPMNASGTWKETLPGLPTVPLSSRDNCSMVLARCSLFFSCMHTLYLESLAEEIDCRGNRIEIEKDAVCGRLHQWIECIRDEYILVDRTYWIIKGELITCTQHAFDSLHNLWQILGMAYSSAPYSCSRIGSPIPDDPRIGITFPGYFRMW